MAALGAGKGDVHIPLLDAETLGAFRAAEQHPPGGLGLVSLGRGGRRGWRCGLGAKVGVPDLSRRARGIMTVGARLRSKAASSLPRCGPLTRGRGRTEGDEEAAAILEHLENGAEAAESEASARRPGSRGARRVHLAVLPERYEPLEEQVPSEKPKKRYRKKLKKYGKVGIPPPPVPWVGHPDVCQRAGVRSLQA